MCIMKDSDLPRCIMKKYKRHPASLVKATELIRSMQLNNRNDFIELFCIRFCVDLAEMLALRLWDMFF